MNLFILVEGKTERKIYPKWLKQLVPQLTKVDRPELVNQNNYNEIQTNAVVEPKYLNEIIKRFEQTGHIASFGNLLNFCKKLNTFNN